MRIFHSPRVVITQHAPSFPLKVVQYFKILLWSAVTCLAVKTNYGILRVVFVLLWFKNAFASIH